uniref:B30.2/SPRY domain-containing protein n=1 Tax=Petromyzon marinus TaxID=7757 RepID=S4RGB4_PETMA
CSPTLNPNSAHRQLQISADLSTVTWNQTAQPYSDHAERFEWWPIVLCFENFSSGDHYWEVDVTGSTTTKWSFALRKSCRVATTGRWTFNEVSWSLKKWDDYKAVHNETETKLTVRDAPKRVGVHVDWEAGVLSFYSADSMSLLHRVSSYKTGFLHPTFWLAGNTQGHLQTV